MSRKTIRSSRVKTVTFVSAGALAAVLNVVPSTAAIADAIHRSGPSDSQSQALPGPNGATSADRDKDRGPQGPHGKPGKAGKPGPQGPQGFQGDTGAQGPQGFQGATGAQGAQGDPGGPQGDQGAQGFQGTAGAQGAQGDQGAQGAGEQGAQGAQGDQGFQGEQGAQGDQGFQGTQGVQGAALLETYVVQGPQGGTSTALCGIGDVATGGGYQGIGLIAVNVERNQPIFTGTGPATGWQAFSTAGDLVAFAICHDA